MSLLVRFTCCKVYSTNNAQLGVLSRLLIQIHLVCFVSSALLHILVTRLDEKQPELLDVSADMPDIAAASALSLNDITAEVKQLQSGAVSVQQELTAVGKEVAAAHRAPLSAHDLRLLGTVPAAVDVANKENFIPVGGDTGKAQRQTESTGADKCVQDTEWRAGLDIELAKSCRDKLAALADEVSEVVNRQRKSTSEMELAFASLLTLYGEDPNCTLGYSSRKLRFFFTYLRLFDLHRRQHRNRKSKSRVLVQGFLWKPHLFLYVARKDTCGDVEQKRARGTTHGCSGGE